jgi:hypothetical protein
VRARWTSFVAKLAPWRGASLDRVLLPWERLLWHQRTGWPLTARILLTDFRIVRLGDGPPTEVAVDDIREIRAERTRLDRWLGTHSLHVRTRTLPGRVLVFRHVKRGTELTALLQLLSGEPRAWLDSASVEAAMSWQPRVDDGPVRHPVVSLIVVIATLATVAIGLKGNVTTVSYPPDDAIYPGGRKQDRDTIVRFMETTVMPWAKTTLGPLKGGADKVTCETCHGQDPGARNWEMPAVAALPEPHVRERGWEVYSGGMDAQMRNAIYGYAADAGKQSKARLMKEAVMPGMASLLRRPAYDFTQPYDFNRAHFAFGCYHCHKVK